MNPFKVLKDYINKTLLKRFYGDRVVPRELLELHDYFRLYGPINFEYKQEGDVTVAISTNFRFGAIVTSGKDKAELEENIKDAILTSFDLPSVYASEAKIVKEGQQDHSYALA